MREEKMLSACLMDSNAEVRQSRRARRREAIIVAIAFEAALLAWLVLWPILTPGSPPSEIVMLPRIPFPSSPAPRPRALPHAVQTPRSQVFSKPVFAPLRIPARIEMGRVAPSANPSPPDIGFGSETLPTGFPGTPGGLGEGNWAIAAPQPKPRMIHASEGVQAGMLIHRVDPQYPAVARLARIAGTVELRAIIGPDGRVRSVEVLSGSPLLARAAEEAVWQWRYRPTLLDGEAVEVETRITVRFVLGP
jgi:periplasmic protein TonB